MGLADKHDGAGGQVGVLPDAETGAQQELHRDPDEVAFVSLGGLEQAGRGLVIEGFG
ncbi:MAG: hypothetical protein ABI083_08360 [Lapillicoccus sp.]